MVDPLTPLHQQVGQGGVQRDVTIVSEQQLLRDQPHLHTPEKRELKYLMGQRTGGGGGGLLHALTGGRVKLW